MSRNRVGTKELSQDDAVCVAQSLMKDFTALIAIFDGQDTHECKHCRSGGISDARLAAQRGLQLSQQLAELLRKNS